MNEKFEQVPLAVGQPGANRYIGTEQASPGERIMAIGTALCDPDITAHDKELLMRDGYRMSMSAGIAAFESKTGSTIGDDVTRSLPASVDLKESHHGTYTLPNHEPEDNFSVVIGVDFEAIRRRASYLVDDARKEGVRLDLAQACAITFLDNVGHEAGHVVADSRAAQYSGHDSEYTDFELSLLHRPARGLTGNLKTDAAIEGERFARGFELLVLQRVAASMGLSARDIRALVRIKSRNTMADTRSTDPRDTPFDVLPHVTPDVSFRDAASGKLWYDELDEGAYNGKLGYAEPLSPRGLVRAIKTIDAAARAKETGRLRLRPEEYGRRKTIGMVAFQRISGPHRRLRDGMLARRERLGNGTKMVRHGASRARHTLRGWA